MDNIYEKTLLYDFYSELLTEKQKSFFTQYYFDDLSLNEIGEKRNITPQGVRDLLKRTEKLLINYEAKLKLLEKYLQTENDVAEIRNFIENANDISKFSKESLIKLVSKFSERGEV